MCRSPPPQGDRGTRVGVGVGVAWRGVVWCGRGRVRRGGVEEEFRSLKQVNNWKLHFLILLSVPWKSENRLRGKEGGRAGHLSILG